MRTRNAGVWIIFSDIWRHIPAIRYAHFAAVAKRNAERIRDALDIAFPPVRSLAWWDEMCAKKKKKKKENGTIRTPK